MLHRKSILALISPIQIHISFRKISGFRRCDRHSKLAFYVAMATCCRLNIIYKNIYRVYILVLFHKCLFYAVWRCKYLYTFNLTFHC